MSADEQRCPQCHDIMLLEDPDTGELAVVALKDMGAICLSCYAQNLSWWGHVYVWLLFWLRRCRRWA